MSAADVTLTTHRMGSSPYKARSIVEPAATRPFRRSAYSSSAVLTQLNLDRALAKLGQANDQPRDERLATMAQYINEYPIEWREHFLRDHGADWSADQALLFFPHSSRASTLWKWWRGEPTAYSPPDGWKLNELLADTWTDDDLPSAALSKRQWARMFRASGFLSDGPPKPDGPVRLFRAARPEGAAGLSWTASLDVAKWYQETPNGSRMGTLYGIPSDFLHGREIYTCVASPRQVLARFSERAEDEYVIDVSAAHVHLLSPDADK